MNNPTVILDSGAYTAYNKGMVIDIDEYASFIKKNQSIFVNYFNLDVINDSKRSYWNWQYLRSCGIETIPVYHMITGEEHYLKKYLKQTDYIALGAIANLKTEQRRIGLSRIWNTYLLDEQGNPKIKVHGLGLTDTELMTSYPWYSVDSFTPAISAIWGAVLLPEITFNGQFNYNKFFVCRISSQARHSLGITGAFLNLPLSLRNRYIELIKENGFDLGDILYQEKKPRRGQSRQELTQTMLFNLVHPLTSEKRTLANHWEERMRWNLTMWVKLQQLMPQMIMYMGASTVTHFRIYGEVKPYLNVLISYAYMSEKIQEQIKKYIRNENQ